MLIIPPESLLEAYAEGFFPMADTKDSETVDFYAAKKRGIIPIEKFHVSKNVLRIVKQNKFELRLNTCFSEVIEACANRDTSWINPIISNSFQILHEMGHAHSVEVFNKTGKMVGGLYGAHLGAAFFGESMFKTEKEADKIALYYCHQILKKNGFLLWDTQFYTEHLGQFGCIEITSTQYLERLDEALGMECKFRK